MHWVAVAFMSMGAVFMLIAAVGVARLPDLFTRMQAATKTGAAGAGSILVGVAVYFSEAKAVAEAAVVILFLLLTAPVAAHLLARAAYNSGVPLDRSTSPDELRERRERDRRK